MSPERRQEMGSRAQEGLAFETSSIVTKMKEMVTKVAGLGVRGRRGGCVSDGGKMKKFLCNIFYFPREI